MLSFSQSICRSSARPFFEAIIWQVSNASPKNLYLLGNTNFALRSALEVLVDQVHRQRQQLQLLAI